MKALTQASVESSPVPQQIGLLNLRISDMMTQLNTTLKALLEENNTLKKENSELKTTHEKISK